jgi:hypothetical protein
MPHNNLHPFRYRIVFPVGSKRRGSAIHTFYAPSQSKADSYAKDWARHRKATKLTRVRKDRS